MSETLGHKPSAENARGRVKTLCIVIAAAILQVCLGSRGAIATLPATCMEADKPSGWVSGGLLTQRIFNVATGRPEPAYILVMPQAECLKGRDNRDNVRPTRTVQLYSSNSAIEKAIRRFVGKRVMVEGRAFGATTVHHHAPIVVDISSIDEP